MGLEDDDVLSAKEIRTVIREKLGTRDFIILEQNLKPVDKVVGYMGRYFQLSATVRLPDRNNRSEQLRFFIKRMPISSSVQTELISANGAFRKEVAAYTKIFKAFEKSPWAPQCYLGRSDDVIVLEDVTAEGYNMGNKFDYFDVEKCEVVLKKLVQLHAQSFILEEKLKSSGTNDNLWDLFGEHLNEAFFVNTETSRGQKYVRATTKAHVKMLEFLNLPEDETAMLRKTAPEVMQKIFENVEPSKEYRNVICHGDLWSNNILFSWKNGRISDCFLVDYQLIRYNPPAHDIVCFLHFTTSLAFRKLHEDRLIRFYHEHLASALAESNLSTNEILPLDILLESCQRYKRQGVLEMLNYMQLLMAGDEITEKYFKESPELVEEIYDDKTSFVVNQYETSPIYREKLTDCLLAYKDMYDTFYT